MRRDWEACLLSCRLSSMCGRGWTKTQTAQTAQTIGETRMATTVVMSLRASVLVRVRMDFLLRRQSLDHVCHDQGSWVALMVARHRKESATHVSLQVSSSRVLAREIAASRTFKVNFLVPSYALIPLRVALRTAVNACAYPMSAFHHQHIDVTTFLNITLSRQMTHWAFSLCSSGSRSTHESCISCGAS